VIRGKDMAKSVVNPYSAIRLARKKPKCRQIV